MFQTDETKFRDFEENPIVRAYCAERSEFSSAARRWQGAMAGGALCLPPCPSRLPLLFPKISLRCDFREPCLFFEARHYKTRTAFTFPAKALRQIGCAGAKTWFCLREYLVHTFLGRMLPAIFRDVKTIPRGAVRLSAWFSSLRSSRQGAMAGGALCLPPCPLRLPLLFPKNLAALRFSGTLCIP